MTMTSNMSRRSVPGSPGTLAPLLVSEREAAKLLGICPRSLWTLRQSGEIPHIRFGRTVRYAVADIETWINTRRHGESGATSG